MNQIEDMHTFRRIVEAGSISKAAEQLDTVKSAVSRRLVALEKRLNVKLLQRTTRRQSLTEAGKHYYQQCLRLLDDIAEVEAHITNIDAALSGKIRLSVLVSFGLTCLSPALLTFQAQHPQLELSIDFNDRFVDLVADGFDLAIRIGKLEDSTLMAKKISVTRLYCVPAPTILKHLAYPKTPETYFLVIMFCIIAMQQNTGNLLNSSVYTVYSCPDHSLQIMAIFYVMLLLQDKGWFIHQILSVITPLKRVNWYPY